MFAFQPAVEFTPRRLLFAFNTQKECDKWKLTTDAEYGGRSSASFTSENGVGVFRGYLDVDTSGTDMRQSGFCALTCPIFSPPLDLTEYAALQFRIRTNGGVFISNMKLLDGATDELFQCFMLPPAQRKPAGQQPRYVRRVSPYDVAEATAPVNTKTDWSDLTLGFKDYQLTWRGFLENSQSSAVPKNILSFGILMAQRVTGPFTLEIRDIHAIDANSLQKRFDGT